MNDYIARNKDDAGFGEIAIQSAGMIGADSELGAMDSMIIALLRAIADDKRLAKNRYVMAPASPLGREELYWNVCADEPDEAVLQFQRPPSGGRLTLTAPETRGTIVLAEDDAVTRMLLDRVLTRAGFTVHACENGRLACDEVQRTGADVVLLDWMMPVMDGPAALKCLKGNIDTRGIPVMMLTMQSDVEERVVAFETGVQDYLTKPFDPRELVARIEQQLRWRRMLAVDANRAFGGQRLELYRPVFAPEADELPVQSFFDRIWGPPKPPAAGTGAAA